MKSQSLRHNGNQPKKNRLHQQAGQVIIENVLLIVVLMSVFFSIIDFLKRQEFATKFTEAPWAMLNGMIQCGVWSPCSVEKPVGKKHPNAGERILSLDPKMVAEDPGSTNLLGTYPYD